jgi:hypothetical protein
MTASHCSWYLDWCPRATNASTSQVKGDSADRSEIVFANSWKPVRDVEFFIRRDGLFLFKVEWKAQPDPQSYAQRLDSAYRISHWIKNVEGHTHQFNARLTEGAIARGFPTLTVGPVELALDGDPGAAVVLDWLEHDDKLIALDTRPKPPKPGTNAPPPSVPAILTLRLQYAKMFDKGCRAAKLWKEKGTTLAWGSHAVRIKYFSVIWPFAIALGYIFISTLISAKFYSGEGSLFIRFGDRLADDLQIGSAILAIYLFSVSVQVKRRKCLKALKKARGYLLYGEILNSTLTPIVATVSSLRAPQGFSQSIAILETIIDDEESRSRKDLIWVALLGSLGYSDLINYVSEYLPFIKQLDIFKLVS